LPRTIDQSDAFFRRWIIIKFLKQFSDAEADKQLIVKLTTDCELSGLFNKSMLALEQLLARGYFSNSKSVEETRDDYIRNSDSFSAFCAECLEEALEDCVAKETLVGEYKRYCSARHIMALSEKLFFQLIPSRFRVGTERIGPANNRKYILRGIRLKDVQPVHDVQDKLILIAQEEKREENSNIMDMVDNVATIPSPKEAVS
jgi:putative DNA primase/helicase